MASNATLTVPEAARRAGRDPETIRRWIRGGKLRARKIGRQHVIEERDPDEAMIDRRSLPMPPERATFESGAPQPDWVVATEASRRGR